jgi:uncharacterized LabA/DUF88 family protein
MDLEAFKKEYIVKTELGIDGSYGRVLVVLDFGNVDYWFSDDRQDADNKALADDEKLAVSMEKLNEFCSLFSDHIRFYYGHDSEKEGSLRFIAAARHVFGKNRVFTKPIQKIRHHLKIEEIANNTRVTHEDGDGTYIYIPKCNFDVEISVDAIRLMEGYDTLALFSGDADFVSLARFLRKKGNDKKLLLFKGGNITADLRNVSNKIINAQSIKRHIAGIRKQKPGS